VVFGLVKQNVDAILEAIKNRAEAAS
jgi:hypothetical protein